MIPINFWIFWLSSKKKPKQYLRWKCSIHSGVFSLKLRWSKFGPLFLWRWLNHRAFFALWSCCFSPDPIYVSIPPRGLLGIDWNMWKPRSNSMQFIPSSWYQIPPRKLWIRYFGYSRVGISWFVPQHASSQANHPFYVRRKPMKQLQTWIWMPSPPKRFGHGLKIGDLIPLVTHDYSIFLPFFPSQKYMKLVHILHMFMIFPWFSYYFPMKTQPEPPGAGRRFLDTPGLCQVEAAAPSRTDKDVTFFGAVFLNRCIGGVW